MRRRRVDDDAIPVEVDSFEAYRRRFGGDVDAWRKHRHEWARVHPELMSPVDAICGSRAVRLQVQGVTPPYGLPRLIDGRVLTPSGTKVWQASRSRR